MATTTVKSTHFYQLFSETLRVLKEEKPAYISAIENNGYSYKITALLNKHSLLIILMTEFLSHVPCNDKEIACKKREIINEYQVRLLSDSSSDALSITQVVQNLDENNIIDVLLNTRTERAIEILEAIGLDCSLLSPSSSAKVSDDIAAPNHYEFLERLMRFEPRKGIAIARHFSGSDALAQKLIEYGMLRHMSSPPALEFYLSKLTDDEAAKLIMSTTMENFIIELMTPNSEMIAPIVLRGVDVMKKALKQPESSSTAAVSVGWLPKVRTSLQERGYSEKTVLQSLTELEQNQLVKQQLDKLNAVTKKSSLKADSSSGVVSTVTKYKPEKVKEKRLILQASLKELVSL